MKHLKPYNEAAFKLNRDTGKLDKISDTDFEKLKQSGEVKKLSLKDVFSGPIKTPYKGLVIKTNDDVPGVIIDVFERNGDFLFDLFLNNGTVEKNLSWARDYKTAYGDRVHGWGAFGTDGVPNERHEEVLEMLDRCEDYLGLDLSVGKDSEIN